MSEPPETAAGGTDTVAAMKLRAAVIELVVSDMAASLAFYRRLGFAIPDDAAGPHAEADLGGGLRIAWDTQEVIRSFDPGWAPPQGAGHRVALAFDCETPDAVDAAWADLTGAGYDGHLAPWDAVWGMRYAVVHDPDGTPVDLDAWRPAE
jgi:catechol 2,3-dioxygenase-like lactoylglutathione lyase family enzyme